MESQGRRLEDGHEVDPGSKRIATRERKRPLLSTDERDWLAIFLFNQRRVQYW